MAGADIVARLAQYGLLSLLFGLTVMPLYAPVAPLGRGATRSLTVAAAFATLVGLLVMAAQLSDDPGVLMPLSDVWSTTTALPAGVASLARLGLLILLAAVSPLARPWPARIVSGLALASLAWSGHAAAGEGVAGPLRLAADIVHLLAAGVWLGALAGLLRLAWRRDDRAATALESFSGVGAGVVAALIASGLVNLLADSGLRPVSVLTAAAWGRLLTLKLGLFAAMLALAGANRFWLTPRLKADGRAPIRASLALETALGLAVLVLVAILGRLAPFGDG